MNIPVQRNPATQIMRTPVGWLLETIEWGGSGHGDEKFAPALYSWQTWTEGHLWWKRSVTGWKLVKIFYWGTPEDAVRYAWATFEASRIKPPVQDLPNPVIDAADVGVIGAVWVSQS